MPATDAARRLLVERSLVRGAFDHLTVDAFMTLAFEALGPTKALLKRFLSTETWTPADDEALADVVGPGEGWWRRDLDADVTLQYGWKDGRFQVHVESGASGSPDTEAAAEPEAAPVRLQADPLADTFDGPVVPEATPNPRTIRFQVGAIHDGASRWFESAGAAADEPGSHRLFAEFPEVANVLVGPEFVAVGLRRADDWERLLSPVLAVVTDEFASPDHDSDGDAAPRVMGGPAGVGTSLAATTGNRTGHRVSRLEQAWLDLGSLRPAGPGDLATVRAAAHGEDVSRRQVATSLLREADAEAAVAEWARLSTDPSRAVRWATADAMVDVNRQELRPLLETALADTDAWVRWKALRGLAELGAASSREVITDLADDPDFRVRLEVAATLRSIA